jgi:hypothetical protein
VAFDLREERVFTESANIKGTTRARSQLIWRGGFLFRNQVRHHCGHHRLPYYLLSLHPFFSHCEMQRASRRQSHRQQKPQQQHHHHNVAVGGGGADFKGFLFKCRLQPHPACSSTSSGLFVIIMCGLLLHIFKNMF